MRKRWIVLTLCTLVLLVIGCAVGTATVRQEPEGTAYQLYFLERTLADADGGDAEDGDADRRDDKADDRGQGILPRHLAEVDGEDQVPGPEEHSEQCSGNKNFLPER